MPLPTLFSAPEIRALEGGCRLCLASAGQRSNGGVGTLLSPQVSPLLEGAPEPVATRIIQIKLRDHPGDHLYVLCCYAPTAGASDAEKEES